MLCQGFPVFEIELMLKVNSGGKDIAGVCIQFLETFESKSYEFIFVVCKTNERRSICIQGSQELS